MNGSVAVMGWEDEAGLRALSTTKNSKAPTTILLSCLMYK